MRAGVPRTRGGGPIVLSRGAGRQAGTHARARAAANGERAVNTLPMPPPPLPLADDDGDFLGFGQTRRSTRTRKARKPSPSVRRSVRARTTVLEARQLEEAELDARIEAHYAQQAEAARSAYDDTACEVCGSKVRPAAVLRACPPGLRAFSEWAPLPRTGARQRDAAVRLLRHGVPPRMPHAAARKAAPRLLVLQGLCQHSGAGWGARVQSGSQPTSRPASQPARRLVLIRSPTERRSARLAIGLRRG